MDDRWVIFKVFFRNDVLRKLYSKGLAYKEQVRETYLGNLGNEKKTFSLVMLSEEELFQYLEKCCLVFFSNIRNIFFLLKHKFIQIHLHGNFLFRAVKYGPKQGARRNAIKFRSSSLSIQYIELI